MAETLGYVQAWGGEAWGGEASSQLRYAEDAGKEAIEIKRTEGKNQVA